MWRHSGKTDVLGFRSVGLSRDEYIGNVKLALTDKATNLPVYYVTVKAVNGAGKESAILSSRWGVAHVLSLVKWLLLCYKDLFWRNRYECSVLHHDCHECFYKGVCGSRYVSQTWQVVLHKRDREVSCSRHDSGSWGSGATRQHSWTFPQFQCVSTGATYKW